MPTTSREYEKLSLQKLKPKEAPAGLRAVVALDFDIGSGMFTMSMCFPGFKAASTPILSPPS